MPNMLLSAFPLLEAATLLGVPGDEVLLSLERLLERPLPDLRPPPPRPRPRPPPLGPRFEDEGFDDIPIRSTPNSAFNTCSACSQVSLYCDQCAVPFDFLTTGKLFDASFR